MKIVSPTRFFAGNSSDEDYSTKLWNNRLVARQDIVCQYLSIYNREEAQLEDWKNIQDIPVSGGVDIKWIRLSYDLGNTWTHYIPLMQQQQQQQQNYPSIITTFRIPPQTDSDDRFLVGQNNPYYDQDPTYQYCFRYTFESVEQFDAYKYEQILLFIQSEGGIILNISAPIIKQRTETGGYLDILFAEQFFEQYNGYDCIVKIK